MLTFIETTFLAANQIHRGNNCRQILTFDHARGRSANRSFGNVAPLGQVIYSRGESVFASIGIYLTRDLVDNIISPRVYRGMCDLTSIIT
jgi:hypothetical protein